MIRDDLLVFGENQRPAAFPVPTVNPGGAIGAGIDYFPAPFSTGYTGVVTPLDLRVAMDLGAGATKLKARFEVVTAFTDPNALAADQNLARFCIMVAPVQNLSVGAHIIGRSGGTNGFAAGALVPGFVSEIIVPPLDSLARLSAAGFRYLGLAMELRVPVADFTAGGVDARLVLDTEQEQYLGVRVPASGFHVE